MISKAMYSWLITEINKKLNIINDCLHKTVGAKKKKCNRTKYTEMMNNRRILIEHGHNKLMSISKQTLL